MKKNEGTYLFIHSRVFIDQNRYKNEDNTTQTPQNNNIKKTSINAISQLKRLQSQKATREYTAVASRDTSKGIPNSTAFPFYVGKPRGGGDDIGGDAIGALAAVI